ncbi:outer membrane beta-barrel protein [Rufibacter roseus]|uniref:Outer membrane beta-barrel protein n=1 Tax=Rufibacter roseus TaxID=1567108 RepID=A0ABW2DL27_9BACT|nr:outer membrane beta-barrel protein [Rufibacter roseus]
MLKKSFSVLALAMALAFPAFSQTSGTGFKPQTGDITTEVQLSLFTESSTIRLNQIRGRYFLSPTSAFRLGLTLNSENYKENDIERNYTNLGISPGIEKHFAGTDRLSPYIGAQLNVNKAWYGEEGPNYEVENGHSNGGQAFVGLGLGAVAGADFYVAPRLYLGVEFGYGFYYNSYSKSERIVNGNTSTVRAESSSFGLRENVQSGIRVGFAF